MRYWFNSLFQTQFKRISVGILLALITAFAGVSLLMLSGWFITATAITGLSIAVGAVIVFDMYMPGSGIRFFALSRTVGRYAERLYNHDTILRLIAVYRLNLYKRLSALSLNELRSTSDSEWLSRLTADLDALDSLLLRFTITPIVIVLIVSLATLFTHFIWPEYASIVGLYLLACGFIAIYLTVKTTKSMGSKNASLLNIMRANVIEHLQGRFELTSRMLTQRHERHLLSSLTSLTYVQKLINNRVANIQLFLDLLLTSGMCLLAIITLQSVNAGEIEGPVAVMVVLMFVGISELLQVLPAQFKHWGGTSYSANRLAPTPVTISNAKPNSVFLKNSDDLRVIIDNHPHVLASQLKPITITIHNTDNVVISGQSGAGKSTVANIIAGLSNSSTQAQGKTSITLVEKGPTETEISSFSLVNIGYLTQSNSILAGTLGYNLSLGLHDVTDEQLWSVLKLVELYDWAHNLSNGLSTWLGDTGAQLSGGQARRITLARMLLRDPAIVILDEPFNGLDLKLAKRIWNNISDWLAKRKVVLLSHEYPESLFKNDIATHIDLHMS